MDTLKLDVGVVAKWLAFVEGLYQVAPGARPPPRPPAPPRGSPESQIAGTRSSGTRKSNGLRGRASDSVASSLRGAGLGVSKGRGAGDESWVSQPGSVSGAWPRAATGRGLRDGRRLRRRGKAGSA